MDEKHEPLYCVVLLVGWRIQCHTEMEQLLSVDCCDM